MTRHQIRQRSCTLQPIVMISDDNFGERDEIYGGIGIQYSPRVCVDYLSHDWKKEDDIWASWKAMKAMSKKKEFANGVRLENASWRTWAKQKYNLKTVNPEKLNWLKDSDVTWLYGPLHTDWSNDFVSSPKSPTTEDKFNLMPSSTKSCLKKKSIAEILRPVLGERYGSLLETSNSDTQLYKKDRDFEVDSDCETSSTCSSMSGPTTPPTEQTESTVLPTEKSSKRKSIQFNDHVEQYMVVESDEEDSSDDGIVMNPTITKLAPTKLKEERKLNNEYSALYTGRRATSSESSTSSSNSNTSASASASASTSASTSTSTSSPPSWAIDDDDDYLDFLDFDNVDPTNPTNSPPLAQPHSSHKRNHSGDIIPPYNATDENQHFHDDDDDIIDKAVNLVRWVLKIRDSLFY